MEKTVLFYTAERLTLLATFTIMSFCYFWCSVYIFRAALFNLIFVLHIGITKLQNCMGQTL
jgi:hypothetical protein